MSADDMTAEKHHHGRYAFIPAGALIGLGIGLLTGYAGPGVPIGLGPGFIAPALVPPGEAGGVRVLCPLQIVPGRT